MAFTLPVCEGWSVAGEEFEVEMVRRNTQIFEGLDRGCGEVGGAGDAVDSIGVGGKMTFDKILRHDFVGGKVGLHFDPRIGLGVGFQFINIWSGFAAGIGVEQGDGIR